MAKILAACPQCGDERLYKPSEITRRDGMRYCSRACYFAKNDAGVMVTCTHCSTEFRRTRGQVASNATGKHYCSKTCLRADSAKVTVACPQCHTPVTAYRSTLNDAGEKYCSKQCHDDARRIPVAERQCEECGGMFVPFRAHQDTARWCSVTCYERSGSVDHPCTCCGRNFRAHRSAVARSATGRLHCPDCLSEARETKVKVGRPTVKRTVVHCAHCGADKSMRVTDVERSATKRFFCNATCRRAGGARARGTQQVPCQQCGNPFKTRTGVRAQRLCSPECRAAAVRDSRTVRHCRHCGERFRMFPSEPDVYCSANCAREARKPTGERARYIDDNGYGVVYCDPDLPEHRLLQLRGWTLEHRAVMAQLLNRPLIKGENCHHINGNRSDNTTDGPLRWHNGHLRSGNLELWIRSQPSGQRVGEAGPFDAALYPGAPS